MTKQKTVGIKGVRLEVLLVTVGEDIFESCWGIGLDFSRYLVMRASV